ncbi:MAG: PAS domain S-box protein [Verrucomicrobia bacterium]|nr:PAS domain S-box protein [Verrucomicrobiota bacterium]
MKVSSILIVEDESILAQDIWQMLTGFGYSVLGIESTGRDAINRLDTVQPDLILMDIHLRGEMDGIDTARAIRESHDIPVVYLTAYADQDTLERAKITEPFGYILKPFDNRELHTVIEMGLYKHRMERNLRDSEVKYRTLFEQATDAIFVADSAGSYIDVSPSACKMVGYSRAELLEFSIDTLIPNEDSQSDPLQLTDLKTGKEVFGERRFRCKDKRILTVEVSAKMLNDGRIQMLARDITKRKELEEEKIHLERQLLHFQKLETIGTLAGGIAHDFNNILTPIMGYADMALSHLPSGTALRDDLKHIVKGAHRARALVEQILLFSKNIEKERKPLSNRSSLPKRWIRERAWGFQ